MAIIKETDERLPTIRPSVDLGIQRYSSFESMALAKAQIAITLILIAICGCVAAYFQGNPKKEIYVFGSVLFIIILAPIVVYGIIRAIAARRQTHLFEQGVVQTDQNGNELSLMRYVDIESGQMKHVPYGGKLQMDCHECSFTSAENSIKFIAGEKREGLLKHHSDLTSLVDFLRSKVPVDVELLGAFYAK